MSRTGIASAATTPHRMASPAATQTALVCVTRGVNAAHYPIGCRLMPDDLRDRIAAAIVGEGCPCTYCTGFALEKADAVIAALGLHREIELTWDGPHNRETAHRYVTEWENDD